MKNISNTVKRSYQYEKGLVTIDYMLTGVVVICISVALVSFIHGSVAEHIAILGDSLVSVKVQ